MMKLLTPTRQFVRPTGFVGVAASVMRRAMPYGPRSIARKLPARALMRVVTLDEVVYRDQWGYERRARLTDELEACGFTGVTLLPPAAARRVGPGNWAVDVGANVGLVAAHLCHLVGPTGSVWAVEPVPHNVTRLRHLKAANGLAQLAILDGALSSSAGTARLRVPESGASGHASLTLPFTTRRIIEVSTWRLDDLIFAEPPRRRLTLLKIDVEGHERAVIEGAERTLRELRPAVFCEFNDPVLQQVGASSAELLEQFRQLGYRPLGRLPRLAGRNVDLLLSPAA